MAKLKKKVTMALLGLGTVGAGVAELLEKNRQLIESRIGASLELKSALVRDLKRARTGVPDSVKLTTDIEAILKDPEIDIVVEVMGGFEPARSYLLKAIDAGKHIVTANKAVLAKYWDEIFSAAHAKNVDVYIEASVGGGIPCVQAINDGLAANRIERLTAIINGTTNYILTGMAAHGKSFDKALKDSQAKGYAEADPSFDIDGMDACHKLAILSSIAFDQRIKIEDIYVEGIRHITKTDIDIARTEMGCVVKHLAMARTRADDSLEVQVVPALLPLDHLLARVDGVYNGILVKGDAVGEVLFSGRGAGKMPTASAVISDIIFTARNVAVGVAGRVPAVAYDIERSSAAGSSPRMRSRTASSCASPAWTSRACWPPSPACSATAASPSARWRRTSGRSRARCRSTSAPTRPPRRPCATRSWPWRSCPRSSRAPWSCAWRCPKREGTRLQPGADRPLAQAPAGLGEDARHHLDRGRHAAHPRAGALGAGGCHWRAPRCACT